MLLWGLMSVGGLLLYLVLLYFMLWASDRGYERTEVVLFKLTVAAGILSAGSGVCFLILLIKWMVE